MNKHSIIIDKLKAQQDLTFQKFNSSLIPNIDNNTIIGVKTPIIKSLIKELSNEEIIDFLNTLPHQYFEENQLHAFLISKEKDFTKAITLINDFLPYINNWATCDQLQPRVFKKKALELKEHINNWLNHPNPFGVRFGIKCIMNYYHGDNFDKVLFEKAIFIKTQEYYIITMIAWLISTDLYYDYNQVIPYLINKQLDKTIHNLAIKKALESYRINNEQKLYLKTLIVK